MDHVQPQLPPDVEEDARNAQELLARHQAGDHILRQPDLRHGRFFLASIGRVDVAMLLSTVIGISLVIASACVLNNYVDRDLDRKMTRTRDRVANLNSMLNFRNWHKVSSSQSTTKQAFSVGGIYHVTVRLSLEPDRHFLGLCGRWRFHEKAVGTACLNVRFQVFRTITFDTLQNFKVYESSHGNV